MGVGFSRELLLLEDVLGAAARACTRQQHSLTGKKQSHSIAIISISAATAQCHTE
jgi:hypothetical protein